MTYLQPTELIFYEHMVFLLDAWNALILGILYLTFQSFPVVFRKHNFDMQQIGMSFLGIGVGMCMSLASQPFFNRCVALLSQNVSIVLTVITGCTTGRQRSTTGTRRPRCTSSVP